MWRAHTMGASYGKGDTVESTQPFSPSGTATRYTLGRCGAMRGGVTTRLTHSQPELGGRGGGLCFSKGWVKDAMWCSLSTERAQELCESRGGRPGLPVPNKLTVSVDVKQHSTKNA